MLYSRKQSTAPWIGFTEVASITPIVSLGMKNVVQPESSGISEFRYTRSVYLDHSGSSGGEELGKRGQPKPPCDLQKLCKVDPSGVPIFPFFLHVPNTAKLETLWPLTRGDTPQ
jgi:hypothetical protein